MFGRRAIGFAAILLCAVAGPVWAQRADAARVMRVPMITAHGEMVPAGAPRATPTALEQRAPDDREQPSAVAAGVLSGIVPGVGSYYAGNAAHGTAHLTVALASGLVSLVVCGQGHDAPCGGMSNAAALVSIVNWGWSIVTAVHDARAAR